MNWLAAALVIVAGVLLLEVAVLTLGDRARRGRLLPGVLAGLFIVLGWNAALRGASLGVVLASLAAAGAAHTVDFARRW